MTVFQLQPLLVPQDTGHLCRLCREPLTQFNARVHMSKTHGDVKYTEVDGRVYLS